MISLVSFELKQPSKEDSIVWQIVSIASLTSGLLSLNFLALCHKDKLFSKSAIINMLLAIMQNPGMLLGSSFMTSFKSSIANLGSFPKSISSDLKDTTKDSCKEFRSHPAVTCYPNLNIKHFVMSFSSKEGTCSILSLISAPRAWSIALMPASYLLFLA